ncbi:MAG TPA: hypothetical protein ENF81_00140 [Thermotogaceae bacterium]|nr:hypothetical protein [Thermotogaceae bacterium]
MALVKNVFTSIDEDVVKIVDKVREEYGMTFRQLVNDSIRHYWENVLNVKETKQETKAQKKKKK